MTADAGGMGAPRFDVVLRGYDRRQVDEHVARLQRVMSRMRADLEMVRSQPIPVVQGPPPGPGRPGPVQPVPRPGPRHRPDEPDMIGSFTDRMQSILLAAEEEAAEIRNKARAGAQAETESVRAELADLMRRRDAVMHEVARLRGQLQGMPGAPTGRMEVAPRDGAKPRQAPGTPVPSIQPPGPGGPKPAPAPGGERPAASGGAPRPRPGPRQAVTPKPGGAQLGGAQPGGVQAGGVQPGQSQPRRPQLGVIQPSPAQPSPAQPSPAQPSPAEPVSAQPASARSGAGQPGAAQPGTSRPVGPPPSGAQRPSGPKPSPLSSGTSAPAQQASVQSGQGGAGQNGSAQKGSGQKGSGPKGPEPAAPQNGAARAGAPPASPARPGGAPGRAPEAGNPGAAAHRLPTGAYPAVGEQSSSMHPRTDPEPADLFRPQAQQGREAPAGPESSGRPGRPGQRPADVEATVKVNMVRPAASSDGTVMLPTDQPATEKKDSKADAERPEGDGSAGPGSPDRSTWTSRSG